MDNLDFPSYPWCILILSSIQLVLLLLLLFGKEIENHLAVLLILNSGMLGMTIRAICVSHKHR